METASSLHQPDLHAITGLRRRFDTEECFAKAVNGVDVSFKRRDATACRRLYRSNFRLIAFAQENIIYKQNI